MSAILNIREGIIQQANARKQADNVKNLMNNEQVAAPDKKKENAQTIDIVGNKQMTSEEMQGYIVMLSKAVMQLTEKLNDKGE